MGRQVVKKMIRFCATCNKLEGLLYSSVVLPDHPSIQSSDGPPYDHTRIDFAYPLFVKAKNRPEKLMYASSIAEQPKSYS